MKPFPETVQKAFPCPPYQISERPWWSHAPVGMIRPVPALNTGVYGGFNAKTDAEAEKIDAEHPIPHPGYRAGQVWASERGSSVALMSATTSTAWICRDLQGITHVSLDSLASLYPYLIADPACPHLAPWSPVEEK